MDYTEKIAGQQAIVDKLAEEYKKNPADDLQLELKLKTDTLLHLKNMAKENPKERAQKAAETAKKSVLGKVIAGL